MNKLIYIALAIVGSFMVVTLATTTAVHADAKDDVCNGVALTGGSCSGSGGGGRLEDTITTVVNILSAAVGIVAVIMIIIGGFKYVISSGDSGNVNSAKNTILYAIIGLVVVAMSQVIVRFVINRTIQPEKTGPVPVKTTALPKA